MFHRHQNGGEVWWFLESTKVSLNTWTHVAVTWDHVRGAVFIYANGQEIANRSYTPGASFFQPTGKLYQIGNDGHTNDHQFHGSVMDLYVFGTAHTLDQINRLRGEFCVTTQSIGYCKPSPKALRASLHPRLLVHIRPPHSLFMHLCFALRRTPGVTASDRNELSREIFVV